MIASAAWGKTRPRYRRLHRSIVCRRSQQRELTHRNASMPRKLSRTLARNRGLAESPTEFQYPGYRRIFMEYDLPRSGDFSLAWHTCPTERWSYSA